jgi:ketosteroid isomerase-like protein
MYVKLECVDDRSAIMELTSRFACAVDKRDWDAVARVFTPDVVIDYNTGAHLVGPDAMVDLIRRSLDRAGPSQHLVGNLVIDLDGDRASATCYVRTFIAGASDGPDADSAYENFAVYYDEVVRTTNGWRVAQRRAEIVHERGNRPVFR